MEPTAKTAKNHALRTVSPDILFRWLFIVRNLFWKPWLVCSFSIICCILNVKRKSRHTDIPRYTICDNASIVHTLNTYNTTVEDRIRIADKNKEWNLQQLEFKYSSPLLSNLQPLQPISSIVYSCLKSIRKQHKTKAIRPKKRKPFGSILNFVSETNISDFFWTKAGKRKLSILKKRWFDIIKFFITSFCRGAIAYSPLPTYKLTI